ncbi:MAG: glycosyltransferase family 2 protein, partial [Bacteroidetes bacterium]|nr:glycosyltransferase family 2 protein [Bacteroidota bacterium]
RVDYIKSALDSAYNQTVKCRILLIDNNSPHQEFKEIVESYNSPLFEYVRMDVTVPQDENFNNCFKFTKTPWLTILHDDDMLHCQFVELAQKIISKHGNTIGGFAVKSEVGDKEWDGLTRKVELPTIFKLVKEPYFYFNHLTPFPGVVVRRDAALDLKGFNAPLYPISDFDFWFRLSKSYKVLFVDQKFAYYRTSPTQSTNTLVESMIKKSIPL